LSFDYKKRSAGELEQIADVVLSRYAHRRTGHFIDIEGIIEDCEITILLRRGELNKYCEGYVATNPHYIVLPEAYASYQPRYRSILAEEFCHIILEYDLIGTGGKLPADAQPHALTPQQHKDIESDAEYLKLALLFPKLDFTNQFNDHFQNAPDDAKISRDKHLIYCAEKLEVDFQVWALMVAYRALALELISEAECRRCFSDRLLM
jgi:Zn-dependent peptidase ImmA (M78 family)